MYEVYIFKKGNKECIMNPNGDPMIATTDTGLLDLISTFYMDSEQNVSRESPKFMGHDIGIKIYPQYKKDGLVMNKTTGQVRRVNYVGVHELSLFNTDSKCGADMQRNGYALARPTVVSKDDWIPIDETDGKHYIYYENSSIGKDPDYDKMEYDGMMTL